jgi:HD-like signal output (HDOD) protein
MSFPSAAPVLTRERILTVARGLPAAPQILAELGELLQDVNTDLDQISDLLRRDAALAARVIRIGNSPAFGGNALASVEEAVNRVGFGEIFRLVGLATTSRLADRALVSYGIEAEPFRANALYHALAAEALAKETDLDARVAYAAGLMRGVGLIVLDRLIRDSAAAATRYQPETNEGYAAWEGRTVALSNTEVAAVILAEWRFPTDVVEGVRAHYLLGVGRRGSRLAVLLNAAGVITSAAGHALAGEASYWTFSSSHQAELGLDDAAFARAAEAAGATFERLKATL